MPVVVHANVPLGVLGHDGNQCSAGLDRGLHRQHRAGLTRLGELECAVGGDRPGYFDLPSLQVDVFHGQRAEFTRSQAGIDGKSGCRNIGVCAERSDIQGLTAGGLVANCETRNGTGFLRLLQGVWVGQNHAPRGDCIYLGRAALCTLCKNAT